MRVFYIFVIDFQVLMGVQRFTWRRSREVKRSTPRKCENVRPGRRPVCGLRPLKASCRSTRTSAVQRTSVVLYSTVGSISTCTSTGISTSISCDFYMFYYLFLLRFVTNWEVIDNYVFCFV